MNKIEFVGKHSLTKLVSRHAHPDWEIIFCTTGGGAMHFDDRILHYQAGDLLVIPPELPHTNISQDGFTNIYLNMEDCSLSNSEPMVISDPENENMAGAFNSALYFYASEIRPDPALMAAFGNLIVTYVALHHDGVEKEPLVQRIESHIIHHFSDSSFDLSAYLHTLPFSYDYLIRMFRKELGITPHKYLIDLRLRSAADWLRNSKGKNISEIAHTSGFKEPLYFSRMFKKKYGISPSFYAQSLEGAPEENQD